MTAAGRERRAEVFHKTCDLWEFCTTKHHASISIPVTKDHPLYQFMRDGDGDGRVCE